MASVSGAHSSRSVVEIIPQYSKSKQVEVGSIRLRPILGVSSAAQTTTSRFPKLEECAHFHYDNVELPPLQVSIVDGTGEGVRVEVRSGSERWDLHRTFQHFAKLDEQLHKCVFAREFSELPELRTDSPPTSGSELTRLLSSYTKRLDEALGGNSPGVSCGPVLTWLELDNRGRRLVASGHGINTPAVAAAFATSTYTASANDELSFQIGDMISVIDMPPAEESVWWRGKRGFVVGFFPSHCVAVITGKIPTELTIIEPSKPVLRKHGKLIAFFRAFILSRPSRRRLKQSGILKERVFGCDLSEHLLNSAREIPLVLKCCADFIENHGIVDGIYRLSGVTSNIQKLRSTFDEDRVPSVLEEPNIRQDIHSVASLLKMYFRELPNPLCTYQLYDEFVNAVQSPPEIRLENITKVVRKLPPPHYRTLEYLMGHLNRVSEHSGATGMTARNVAIVWAPNLLRCKSLGVAALQGVGVQALVTEFLVINYKHIFSCGPHLGGLGRPKSLAVSSPTKLLSLEEAQAREHITPTSMNEKFTSRSKDCGETPKYHTVLDFPRKRQPLNWRTFFTPLRSTSTSTNSKTYSKHKNIVKSAELLQGCSRSGVTAKAFQNIQLDRAPSTHSRSVSHDSYFDNNLDQQPSVSSLHENSHPGLSLSLDLSELQMNFEMDESEMKIFSEDETNQLFSSAASLTPSPLDSDHLHHRLSTQELRYIDSYSPDPMDTDTLVDDPVALGYRPLLTPTSCDNIKPAHRSDVQSMDKTMESSESSRKSISPLQYDKMTESGENSRRSDGSHSVESSQKSGSPVAYEKLESSWSDQNHYETIGETKVTARDTVVLRENNLYESMEHQSCSGGENIYQNEAIINQLKRDPADKIYQQVSSTQEIYEQLSYLRCSVEEVNRLVGGKLTSCHHSDGIGGPPPSKELKKSLSLERISNNGGLKLSEKRLSTPLLDEMKLDPKRRSGSATANRFWTGPEQRHSLVSSEQSLEKTYDAFCDADYENVSFSLPLEIKPSSTNVSRLKSSPVRTLKKSPTEQIAPKESRARQGSKMSHVEKTVTISKIDVPENIINKSDKKPTCSVVSELLKSDIKVPVVDGKTVEPIKNPEAQVKCHLSDDISLVTETTDADEFARQVDRLNRTSLDNKKNTADSNVKHSKDLDSVDVKESTQSGRDVQSSKTSPVVEDSRLIQDLEVKGKTEKLRKFFEKDSTEKCELTNSSSHSKVDSDFSVNQLESKISNKVSSCQDSPSKKEFGRTASLTTFEFVQNSKDSPLTSIRQLSRSPSQARNDFSHNRFTDIKPSSESIPMKPKESKSPVKSIVASPCSDSVIKEPVSNVKEEPKTTQSKVDFFQSKEEEARGFKSKSDSAKIVKEVEKKPPKLEPLPLKQQFSPTHRLISPESPSATDKKIAGESEAERRERIEKYKEERRSFFRNKYKMDNVNNNSDEDLIRRIKEKTGRTESTEKRKSLEKSSCDSGVASCVDMKRPLSKTTVNILYSPTRCQAPAWPTPPTNQTAASLSYPNSPEK